ncbi:SHM4 [Symbiodinium necroappetens]|uniref:SHM4 protein n=1 Tax=Symbiodinium necroappetens TaxID=1628268 RepID=A0A812X1H5_9DINO|nr:SHM4 [Symbiodinium necroappetens]
MDPLALLSDDDEEADKVDHSEGAAGGDVPEPELKRPRTEDAPAALSVDFEALRRVGYGAEAEAQEAAAVQASLKQTFSVLQHKVEEEEARLKKQKLKESSNDNTAQDKSLGCEEPPESIEVDMFGDALLLQPLGLLAMASVKSMIAASLLAAPCADAFVAPGASQSSHSVTGLRGSTAVKAESGFSTALVSATTGAAVLSFVGAKKPDEASFKDLRAKELKHGRLAMMGALGMLTQSLVQLPGMDGVPKDISAFSTGAGQTGFLITIAIIAVLEAAVFVQDDSKEPGTAALQ